jgi:hypothetical protein
MISVDGSNRLKILAAVRVSPWKMRALQELGEIDQLAERRQRVRRIPFNLDRTAERVQRLCARWRAQINQQLLAPRVKR